MNAARSEQAVTHMSLVQTHLHDFRQAMAKLNQDLAALEDDNGENEDDDADNRSCYLEEAVQTLQEIIEAAYPAGQISRVIHADLMQDVVDTLTPTHDYYY